MYSFSQNFEDVYIYRAFRDVDNGFYIDAGAFDPVVDSVTKMLYDLGWSGINLEPGPSFPRFASRARDINLPFALTSQDGEIDFHYNASDPATSTTAASNIPDEPTSVQSYKVRATTLETLVREHVGDRHIHFLKLDVEGAEWDILKSTDWKAVRPELIIAESSLPYSNVRRDDGWASHMNSYGYEEVFFDGINTYYLSSESLHRKEAFKFPVNVIDGIRKFDPYQHYSLSELENPSIVKSISEEVSRVVDEGDSAIRRFIENDVGPRLEAQEKLISKLQSEQSEHFLRLREIAKDLIGPGADASASYFNGGANSIEAVIADLADGVSTVIQQRERHSVELANAQETVQNARAELEQQERRTNEARTQVRLLTKRLATARASRTSMLNLTEKVVRALDQESAPANPGNGTVIDRHEEIETRATAKLQPGSLADRIQNARRVPSLRRKIRFGNRALVRRADAYRDSGRFAEAAEVYARTYALRPDRVDLCLQMANMLTNLGAFDLAEDAYREALSKAPNDGLVLFHFGHMLELSGRPAEAQRAYLESAEHIPDHPDLVARLGRISAARGLRGEQ